MLDEAAIPCRAFQVLGRSAIMASQRCGIEQRGERSPGIIDDGVIVGRACVATVSILEKRMEGRPTVAHKRYYAPVRSNRSAAFNLRRLSLGLCTPAKHALMLDAHRSVARLTANIERL